MVNGNLLGALWRALRGATLCQLQGSAAFVAAPDPVLCSFHAPAPTPSHFLLLPPQLTTTRRLFSSSPCSVVRFKTRYGTHAGVASSYLERLVQPIACASDTSSVQGGAVRVPIQLHK